MIRFVLVFTGGIIAGLGLAMIVLGITLRDLVR